MPKRTKRLTSQGEELNEIRINKFLSEAGVCSRREADRYIEEGKVKIDGEVAQTGSKVTLNSQVTFDGKPVKKEEKLVLIAFNKPEGIVCTTDSDEPDNIIDYINYGMRIFPIGRLDKDSQGLILLTNDGNIVNKILRVENHHEKEYIVTVNKEINQDFIKKMSEGVPILDTITNPCKITQIDRFTFQIILTQGLNRQIRRMCEACGYRVVNLKRIRIMNILLGRLKPGDYRNVTEKEIEELNLQISLNKRAQKENVSSETGRRELNVSNKVSNDNSKKEIIKSEKKKTGNSRKEISRSEWNRTESSRKKTGTSERNRADSSKNTGTGERNRTDSNSKKTGTSEWNKADSNSKKTGTSERNRTDSRKETGTSEWNRTDSNSRKTGTSDWSKTDNSSKKTGTSEWKRVDSNSKKTGTSEWKRVDSRKKTNTREGNSTDNSKNEIYQGKNNRSENERNNISQTVKSKTESSRNEINQRGKNRTEISKTEIGRSNKNPLDRGRNESDSNRSSFKKYDNRNNKKFKKR